MPEFTEQVALQPNASNPVRVSLGDFCQLIIHERFISAYSCVIIGVVCIIKNL